tara:strand:+ start:1033 stop:1233 length:201 start_codon:yes stop_codon:yes gene_type:complete
LEIILNDVCPGKARRSTQHAAARKEEMAAIWLGTELRCHEKDCIIAAFAAERERERERKKKRETER